jgi:hypothetical protein
MLFIARHGPDHVPSAKYNFIYSFIFSDMKMRKKSDLPSKPCIRCGLPFTWRKKWEKVWNDVKYCSERCRRSAPSNGGAQ